MKVDKKCEMCGRYKYPSHCKFTGMNIGDMKKSDCPLRK